MVFLSKPKSILREVGKGFFNLRSPFKLFGFVNIQTHMSFLKLSNGKYLLVDTVPLTPEAKREIDILTDNGKNIEAVIATHPFHTMSFEEFYKAYPDVPYYGTPRHLRNIKSVPWTGDIMKEQKHWEPDVQIRIPEGAEFVAPEPEKTNHFNSAWVYHPQSQTLHVDDTIMYYEKPNWLFRLMGKKKDHMEFHPSMKGPGLHKTKEAPVQFQKWVEQILLDWHFENIVTAHMGVKIGGARAKLQQTLVAAQPIFKKLIKEN